VAATARTVLEHCNRLRVQLGLRELKPTEGNLRPIRGRLRDDISPQDLLVAWLGASKDEWVLSTNHLSPSHVFRPSRVEHYIDLGQALQRGGNGRPAPKATHRNESVRCGECDRSYNLQVPIGKDPPDRFTCAGCKELQTWRERGQGLSGAGDILDSLKGGHH
jgi:hypothetical protein